MTVLLLLALLILGLAYLLASAVRTDGLGHRRPPRGPGDDWTAGSLPSHPYGV